jgi:hypothetical protein
MKLNKAQQEIVGFTLIVVIIVIIGLIFLVITMGKDEGNSFNKAERISKLLSSSMYYTTDCAKDYVPNYRNLQELIVACYNTKKCSDNREPCIVLNDTLKNIIGKSLDVSEESPNKAYSISIKYNLTKSTIPIKEILELNEGKFQNCSSIIGFTNYVQDPEFMGIGVGMIETTLKVCEG